MISKRCKYAIKALAYIARKENNENSFASEIAEKERIPKKFLEGILRDLRNAKLLNSQRGAKGGYSLNQKPEDIILTEIVRLMDGPIALLPCVSLNYYSSCEECKEETNCTIRETFLKIRDATLEVYNSTTLQDLSKVEKLL